jgi:hypothetical protein
MLTLVSLAVLDSRACYATCKHRTACWGEKRKNSRFIRTAKLSHFGLLRSTLGVTSETDVLVVVLMLFLKLRQVKRNPRDWRCKDCGDDDESVLRLELNTTLEI